MKQTIATRFLAVLIVLVVAADWASKLWITNRLVFGETRTIVDGWLYIVHQKNPGVAFSLLSDLPIDWRVPFLSLLAAAGIVVFIGIMRSTADRLTRVAAAAVIAGAIGNTGDRLMTGEVTDFLHLAFFPFVFNLADAAITLGGTLLAFRLATDRTPTTPDSPAASV